MSKTHLYVLILIAFVVGWGIYFRFSYTEPKGGASISVIDSYIGGKTAPPAIENELTLLFWGDSMFGRNVAKNMAKGTDPFEFMATSSVFADADAIILNLEGPITASTTKCQKKAYSFRFEPEIASRLKKESIFAVNLANNHTFDCLEKGRADTRTYLKKAGVNYFGGSTTTESYVELGLKDRKIAFVGLDLTFDYKLDPSYQRLIERLKITNDIVIVSIHWGEEYREQPTASQRLVGKILVDAGADAVIGHHPHIIEPLEIYGNSPIFYSLGNFIFDQIGEEQNTGLGVGITFRENASTTIKLHPIRIDKQRPRLIGGEAARQLCRKIHSTKESGADHCLITI